MPEDKNSFIVYIDFIDHIRQSLSYEQLGIFLCAINDFAKEEKELETDDPILRLVFSIIADQMRRDAKKYKKICERNQKNGKLGGRPKKNPEGYSKTQKYHNDKDNENDFDNGSVNENERHENILVARGKQKVNNFD